MTSTLNRCLGLLAVAAFLPIGIATAQEQSVGYRLSGERQLPTAVTDDDPENGNFANRQLARQLEMTTPPKDFPEVRSQRSLGLPMKADGTATTDSLPTLWANIGYLDGWTSANAKYGYYSFKPTSKTFNPMGLQQKVIAQHGVQLKGGHLYGVNTEFVDLNTTNVLVSDYNTSTWEGTTKTYANRYDLVALETAQDINGTVWGEFYTADGNNMEWGTVDYSTLTRTTIGPATHTFVALGITKAGQLYGVASDGNFYKINKNNGVETLIGKTGFNLLNASDMYYYQTGEIDPRTDTFYWIISTGGQSTGICSVDLQTGKPTVLSGVAIQACGMVIPQAEASKGAPARISDQTASFNGGSLTGQVTFTMPTKTVDGENLTGDLTYTVTANGKQVTTGDADAGEKIDAAITVPSAGFYDVVFTTANDAGTSPAATITRWIGYDMPVAPTNVTATASDDKNVSVSWSAPKTSVHEGAMSTLSYTVQRASDTDTVTVAKNLAETTFTDAISSDRLQYYSYIITPVSQGIEGLKATSNKVLLGSIVDPNWTCSFDTQDEFSKFKVINSNKDSYTWRYNSAVGFIYDDSNSKTGSDDWLITPPLRLEGNRIYRIAFRSSNDVASASKTLEVKMGTSATASGMTKTLIETFRPANNFAEYSCDVAVNNAGIYYIGIHDNTAQAGQFRVWVDSVVVERGSTAAAPEAVGSFTLTPAAKGALSATLTFTVPTKTAAGATLNAVDSVLITRNGQKVATLTNVTPGQAITWTDNSIQQAGIKQYAAVAYAGGEAGCMVKDQKFVGQDIPYSPSNVRLNDKNGAVYASWDAFANVGPNGGYVNTDKVSVSFFTYVTRMWGNEPQDSITTSAQGVLNGTLPIATEVNGSGEATQNVYQLMARANGEAGISGYVLTGAIVLGKSLDMPFRESLKDGHMQNSIIWTEGNAQYFSRQRAATWRKTTDASSDADGGSFIWAPYSVRSNQGRLRYTIQSGDEVTLNMPKVALKGSTNPHAMFSVYANKGEQASLRVAAQKPDGTVVTLRDIDLSATTANGWTTYDIDLNQLKSERYVILKFVGVSKGSDTYVGLDDINMIDQQEYNLAATEINAPHVVTAGKTAPVKVTVKNLGAKKTADFDVVLSAAGVGRDTVSVDKELNPLEETVVSMNLPMAVYDKAGYTKVAAEVYFDDDMNDNDNVADTTVLVRASAYTAVNDLKAQKNGSAVNLTWTKPAQPAPETVTENFDSYAPFVTDIGDWTTVDGDRGLAGGYFAGNTYPKQDTPFAFFTWNSDSLDPSVLVYNPGLSAHSGSQFAAATYSYDQETGNLIDQNNWLITPLLSGRSQTIKFYAFNVTATANYGVNFYPESFDVLYSTTDADTASFTKLGSGVADGQNVTNKAPNWKAFSFDVPEGAKYVAIHHNTASDKTFMFGIDDFTYEKGTPGTSDSISAYIVYRDGKPIATVKATDAMTFTDNADGDGHVWNVTVIYTDKAGINNESGFSNDASLNATGIDLLYGDTAVQPQDVYNAAGQIVRKAATSLKGLPHGVYIFGGKKVVK